MAVAAETPVFHPGAGHFVSKRIDQELIGPPEFVSDHPRWTTPDEGAALLHRDGYVVVPRLFDQAQTGRLLHRLVHDEGPDERYEHKNWCFNKHIGLKLQESTEWLWAIDQEPGIDLLDRLLGSDCKLMAAGLWSTGQGRARGIHADHRAVELPPGIEWPAAAPIPCFIAVLIAALEDQVPEMGPTMVIPGSHRRAPRAGDAPVSPRALLLRRGDGLILRGDICHGAAPNTGPRRRTHFHSTWCSTYIQSWTPPIREQRGYAAEVLAAVTPRQRRILGGWDHPNGGRIGIWRRELGLGGEAGGEYE
jgi:hypothetical protein